MCEDCHQSRIVFTRAGPGTRDPPTLDVQGPETAWE